MHDVTPITIQDRVVGPGQPAYVIAEMSANHHGDFERAKEIVHAAKESGADAIKLQTFTADTHTMDSGKECFRLNSGTIWDGRTLYDLYKEAAMPWDWQPKLKAVADRIGIHLFSAPVDQVSADFLEEMGVPAFKIASFELVDLALIRRAARTGKPLILSTGMATLSEIEEAVEAARSAGAAGIALLKCNSAYPAPPEEMNLRTIPHLSEAFNVPVGLSDHTRGIAVATAAVAVGATLLEKHITLSRNDPGPDSSFSLEPAEFEELVKAVREVEKALGRVRYEASPEERKSRGFRRSLFVVADVATGERFTEENLRSIRPALGLHPRYLEDVLGRRAARDIERGTPLSWDLVV
jgi:N-acetylneuraminate synthase